MVLEVSKLAPSNDALWRNVDVNYTVLSGIISIARSVLDTPDNVSIHQMFSGGMGQLEACGCG